MFIRRPLNTQSLLYWNLPFCSVLLLPPFRPCFRPFSLSLPSLQFQHPRCSVAWPLPCSRPTSSNTCAPFGTCPGSRRNRYSGHVGQVFFKQSSCVVKLRCSLRNLLQSESRALSIRAVLQISLCQKSFSTTTRVPKTSRREPTATSTCPTKVPSALQKSSA